jgi:hypothetical protein
MTHVLTILHPTNTFLDTMNKMMVKFIWQGKYWKHPYFVYGRPENGGIGVHHLPTRIKTLRFSFLQKVITRHNRQNAWYFQAYNIQKYAPALHAEAVLQLNLNPTRLTCIFCNKYHPLMTKCSCVFTNEYGGNQYASFFLFECRNSKRGRKCFKDLLL